MKKGNIIRPTGLKGNEKLNRMRELMGKAPINEGVKRSVVELTKEGPDGKIYAIVRENHEYFIKVSENKSNLMTEDFQYIGGLQNKKDKAYPSYAKAIKQLNLKFMSLNEAIGKKGQINVFEDDNLINEHHPLKADMKLSATKGIGDGQEYVVDKKGAELKADAKEGKEGDGFGDNVADSTAEKDMEEVKLNENEAAIDEMITGEEVIEEEVKYETATVSGRAGDLADYTHFAIHKPTNSIAGNWDYKGYDPDELKYEKDDYFFIDLRDDYEDNVDRFKKSDFVIVTKKGLEKRGIDLNNYEFFKGQDYGNSIKENETIEAGEKVANTLQDMLSPEELNFLANAYKQGGKELIAKSIDAVDESVNEGPQIPDEGEFGMSKNEIKLRKILDKVITNGAIASTLGIIPAAATIGGGAAIGLGIAAIAGFLTKDAAWWKKGGHHYDAQNKYGVKEEGAPKKGFSIARAIKEMDNVIDEISGDDKIDAILESLGEEERAIMMEALKKKD